mmetsp:Transcript_31530/g.78596  ORF Transcript_31530/g.78596 Transcript_31530/m.78596 type:complete len:84 (-) Transcript_31530:345-596(-)
MLLHIDMRISSGFVLFCKESFSPIYHREDVFSGLVEAGDQAIGLYLLNSARQAAEAVKVEVHVLSTFLHRAEHTIGKPAATLE